MLLSDKKVIFAAVILLLIHWFLKALSLYIVVKKNGADVKFYRILELIIVNQFFAGITPFAIGGEPMQIYMLSKQKVETLTATNIILQQLIIYQIVLVFMGAGTLFINYYFKLYSFSSLVTKLLILGFAINILVGIFFIVISFSKKFSRLFVKFIINIGHKFKFIKDKQKKLDEWEEKLKDYNRSADILLKDKKLFLSCMFINLIAIFIQYIIPLVVFNALNFKVEILDTIIFSSFIAVMGNFVPIPGGSGGIEFGFLTFFGLIVPDPVLKSALIVWRFITYYFGMIIGGIFFTLYEGDKKE